MRTTGLAVSIAVLVFAAVCSVLVGARTVSLADIVSAVLHGPDANQAAGVIIEARLPRTVLAIVAGVGLGLAGAIIQAVTRNPLADPGILGVNSGAAFALAIGVGVFGVRSPSAYIWFAFAGALVATAAVYAIGSLGSGSANPMQLTLAGVAIGAVLAGILSALLLTDPEGFQAMRAWEAGTIADRGWAGLRAVWPFVVAGVAAALAITPALNSLALGDDLAAALGANITRTRLLAVLAITLLAGGATAVAGPIAFVGLMIPHVARWVAGPDQRWIAALSILLAPTLLLVADVIGRVVLPSGEVPVGIVTAFVGAPVLIVLVRRQKASGL